MDEELCKLLHDAFEPVVIGTIKEDPNLDGANFDALGLATSVSQIEEGWFYVFQVHLTKPLSIDELMALCEQMEIFSHYGSGPGSCTNELMILEDPWTLGDGDDVLSVTFKDDAFSIWVRMLK